MHIFQVKYLKANLNHLGHGTVGNYYYYYFCYSPKMMFFLNQPLSRREGIAGELNIC